MNSYKLKPFYFYRKCSAFPKMDLSSLECFSCNQDGSPDRPTASHPLHQSFSSWTENSTSASFEPQTFLAPYQTSNTSVNDVVANAEPIVTEGNLPPNADLASTVETLGQFVPVLEQGDNLPSTSTVVSTGSSVPVTHSSVENGATGFSFTDTDNSGTDINVTESVGTACISKPQYEDITPPQTPDSKEVEIKTTSPLLALSSLVLKVPTTTVADTKPLNAVSDNDPVLENKISVNMTSDAVKAQKTDTVTSPMPNFSFKPPSSVPSLKTTLPSSASFSFTPFSPPSTASPATTVGSFPISHTQVSRLSNIPASTSLLFKPPSTDVLSTSASALSVVTEASQTYVTSSSLFSLKPSASSTSTSNMTFAFKPTTSSSYQAASITAVCSEGSLTGKSSFLAVPSKSGNLFGGVVSGTSDVIPASSPVITSTLFTNPGLPTTSTSGFFSLTSGVPLSDSDTASSTSADSDTASNTAVAADNASSSGASDSAEGQETSGGSVFEKQISAAAVTPVPLTSTSVFSSQSSLKPDSTEISSEPQEVPSSDDVLEEAQEKEPSSLFGNKASAIPPKLFSLHTTSANSVFGGTSVTSSGSLFGGTQTSTVGSSLEGISTTSSGSFFGGTSSVFGGISAASGGIFTNTNKNIFGSTTTTSSKSIFGSITTASTGNILGVTPTTSGSQIGASITSTPSSTSGGGIFSDSTTTSNGNLFGTLSLGDGSGSSAAPSAGSIFGNTASTESSTSNPFGTPASASSGATFGQASAFGAITSSSSGSAFSSLSSTAGGFNLDTTTTTSAGSSAFGQTSSQSSNSVFGQSAPSPSVSLFGTSSTTPSVFGSTGQSSSLFASPASQGTGIFGSSSSQSSGSSLLVQPTTSSGFSSGSGGSVFGQTSAAGASPFSTPR